MKKFILVLLAFYLVSSTGFAQWVQTYGPMGGDIKCFLYSNGKLFAGSIANSYYSTDNGNTWQKLNGIEGKTVYLFLLKGTSILAATNNGVYISTDNGVSWNSSSSGMTSLNIVSLANLGNNIYAASDDYSSAGKLYKSTNNGLSWTISVNSIPFKSIYVSGSNIFAGSAGNGIYLSTNEGNNWSTINEGLTNLFVYGIAGLGSEIFAGTNSGIFKSTNNGANWFSSNTGITNNYIMSLGVSGIYIFAGTSSNLYLSTNNGGLWNEVMNGLPAANYNSVFSYGANLYAGSSCGVYFTTNNGTIWTPKVNGISGLNITNIIYSGGVIYAGTNGVYKTTNNGDSWVNAGLSNRNINLMTAIGSNLFAVTNSDFYMSTNSGANWILKASPGNGCQCITTSGNTLFIAAFDKGVNRTTNFGDTWDTVNYGLPTHDITAMGSYNGVIYAGTYGEGTFKSTDNGITWTSINFVGHIMGFAFDGDNIMVGRCDSVFRTSNGGINWYPVSSGLSLYCESTRLYQTGAYVFLSSCGKLFMTTNFGTNWKLKNQGMENINIMSFGASADKVFAGTYCSSVWRRNLSDIIGIQNISSSVPEKYLLMQNYPNPFNPNTSIRYQVSSIKFINLVVYDLLGKEVEVLVNENQKSGMYEVTWDGSNYPSGVYYYRLTAGDFSETRKMVLVK